MGRRQAHHALYLRHVAERRERHPQLDGRAARNRRRPAPGRRLVSADASPPIPHRRHAATRRSGCLRRAVDGLQSRRDGDGVLVARRAGSAAFRRRGQPGGVAVGRAADQPDANDHGADARVAQRRVVAAGRGDVLRRRAGVDRQPGGHGVELPSLRPDGRGAGPRLHGRQPVRVHRVAQHQRRLGRSDRRAIHAGRPVLVRHGERADSRAGPIRAGRQRRGGLRRALRRRLAGGRRVHRPAGQLRRAAGAEGPLRGGHLRFLLRRHGRVAGPGRRAGRHAGGGQRLGRPGRSGQLARQRRVRRLAGGGGLGRLRRRGGQRGAGQSLDRRARRDRAEEHVEPADRRRRLVSERFERQLAEVSPAERRAGVDDDSGGRASGDRRGAVWGSLWPEQRRRRRVAHRGRSAHRAATAVRRPRRVRRLAAGLHLGPRARRHGDVRGARGADARRGQPAAAGHRRCGDQRDSRLAGREDRAGRVRRVVQPRRGGDRPERLVLRGDRLRVPRRNDPAGRRLRRGLAGPGGPAGQVRRGVLRTVRRAARRRRRAAHAAQRAGRGRGRGGLRRGVPLADDRAGLLDGADPSVAGQQPRRQLAGVDRRGRRRAVDPPDRLRRLRRHARHRAARVPAQRRPGPERVDPRRQRVQRRADAGPVAVRRAVRRRGRADSPGRNDPERHLVVPGDQRRQQRQSAPNAPDVDRKRDVEQLRRRRHGRHPAGQRGAGPARRHGLDRCDRLGQPRRDRRAGGLAAGLARQSHRRSEPGQFRLGAAADRRRRRDSRLQRGDHRGQPAGSRRRERPTRPTRPTPRRRCGRSSTTRTRPSRARTSP
mgnify:CR=1 FL=1